MYEYPSGMARHARTTAARDAEHRDWQRLRRLDLQHGCATLGCAWRERILRWEQSQMVTVKHQTPAFTTAEAGHIAELFGVSGTAQPLAGEHDQNFLLTTDDGEQYVLKLSHAAEQRAILDLQNAAL